MSSEAEPLAAQRVRVLPLADRREAAERIIESHPHWSDRMIGSIVNLASTTVRAIRTRSAAERAPSDVRVGRDGRARPVSTAAGRRLAGELLRDNPNWSLREIARSTGLAPSTVLDVRKRLREGQDPVPPRQCRAEVAKNGLPDKESKPAAAPAQSVDRASALQNLRKDPSLRLTDAGRLLLRWFETGPTDAHERTSVANVLPAHCLDTIAILARGQAAAWQELADELDKRNSHPERIS